MLSTELTQRSAGRCELCAAQTELSTFIVAPKVGDHVDEQVAVCATCHGQMEEVAAMDEGHWRFLNESIWSTIPAVQVVSYRMLKALEAQSWAQDVLSMIFLDDATQEWADATIGGTAVHRDSNGNILEAGDTVVLIKDLDVKGATFTAKRGTAVRRISLVLDNPEQIEGKINDQHIVILTKYVKKS